MHRHCRTRRQVLGFLLAGILWLISSTGSRVDSVSDIDIHVDVVTNIGRGSHGQLFSTSGQLKGTSTTGRENSDASTWFPPAFPVTTNTTANNVTSTNANATKHVQVLVRALKHDGKKTAKEQRRLWTSRPEYFSQSYIDSTTPSMNVSTLGYWRQEFYSGYRNQIMGFVALTMWAHHYGHNQLLLETLNHKDTYGSSLFLPFEYLFDVEHWNSFQDLPRLVHCTNAQLVQQAQTSMKHYDCNSSIWKCNGQMDMCTDPYAMGKETTQLFSNYMRYAKGKGPLAIKGGRNPIDITILQGALRPQEPIRELTQKFLLQKTNGEPYFTLHARVEPDMQKHPMCASLKVTNLTEIIISLEQAFLNGPPAKYLFLPINRQSLVKEVARHRRTNRLAVENLRTLNRIVKHGLWNGEVIAFELGSTILQTTPYKSTPSIIGAMINFEVAIGSSLFVGTPVSSWSVDVVASRFYRNLTQNYKYLPGNQVISWTRDTDNQPPFFQC